MHLANSRRGGRDARLTPGRRAGPAPAQRFRTIADATEVLDDVQIEPSRRGDDAIEFRPRRGVKAAQAVIPRRSIGMAFMAAQERGGERRC
jgi:hypothetical protein